VDIDQKKKEDINRNIYLFNDLLLITKPTNKPKDEVVTKIPVNDLVVASGPDTEGLNFFFFFFFFF